METIAALYPDTTTTEALGVDALLLVRPYQVLAHTNKSHTRRVTVHGRDLAAKIVDFHGTPKHTSWSARELYDLEWNEVRAYHALKALQGRVVPEFLYHGSDLNFLWATAVTTYEGVSLRHLVDDKGKLPAGAKAKAIGALRALHAAGVLHGDAELRNAVWRERDGAVLWMNLEMAMLRDEVNEFAAKAEREVADVASLLEDVAEEAPPPRRSRCAFTRLPLCCA